MRTQLFIPGNTAGYTYSFINKNFKYIVYSISGSYDYSAAGLIVQPVGEKYAIQDMSCQKTSIFDPDNNAARDITLKWPTDTVIEEDGLPRIR
jgi:hypothetical protein